jgi:hypothetical protein
MQRLEVSGAVDPYKVVRRLRVNPCGQTDGQTHRHLKKLIVAFRSFANAPKCLPENLT